LISVTIVGAIAYIHSINKERARTLAEQQSTQAINQMLINMFVSADPAQSRGNDVLVIDLLDRAADELRKSTNQRPEVRASLSQTIAQTYLSLGKAEASMKLADEALNEASTQLGSEHRLTLMLQNVR